MNQEIAVQEIRRETMSITERVHAMVITNDQDYAWAGVFFKRIKSARKAVEETFRPVIDSAHKAHRAAIDALKKHDDPLAAAQKIADRKISDYDLKKKQEARRIEAERMAEARRKAEAEAEARRREEEDRRLAQAAELQANGDAEAAEVLLDAPVQVEVAPVVIEPVQAAPKIEGMHFRTNWKFRVTNPAMVPEEYKVIDEKKIGAVVRALKDACRIPGVEVYSEQITV